MLVAGELFAGQWGVNDGLRFNGSLSSDENNDTSAECSNLCPEGLHVDTNNGSIYRSATLILYLNDIASECGGATVFPLANTKENDPTLAAAKRLLQDNVEHTRGAAGSTGVLPHNEEDMLLLEEIIGGDGTNTVVRVQPQAGRLCIFFSRTADGEIDARSWHGGERLLLDNHNNNNNEITEKNILTLFKEVYYGKEHPDTYDNEGSFETYLAPQIAEQRQLLQDIAKHHAHYFV